MSRRSLKERELFKVLPVIQLPGGFAPPKVQKGKSRKDSAFKQKGKGNSTLPDEPLVPLEIFSEVTLQEP